MAQEDFQKEVRGTFGLDVEQDLFTDFFYPDEFNEDRNYTQGTIFSYSHPNLYGTPLFIPNRAIDRLTEIFAEKVGIEQEFLNSTIGIGVSAFTPLVLDSVNPIVGDRPFAGVAMLATSSTFYYPDRDIVSTNSLHFGLFGTNITNTFQSYAHKEIIKGRPHEISWHHQISNGGHFGFLFSHESRKTILDLVKRDEDDESSKSIVFSSIGTRFDLGWYCGVSVPIEIRIGSMSKYSKLLGGVTSFLGGMQNEKGGHETDEASISNRKTTFGFYGASTNEFEELNGLPDPYDDEPGEKKRNYWDFYVFGTLTPRLMPYNSFILGQPFVESEYTLPNEDYNPFASTFEYGVVLSRIKQSDKKGLFSRFDLLFSYNHRSPEIRNEEYKRWHHWGRFSIRFPLF